MYYKRNYIFNNYFFFRYPSTSMASLTMKETIIPPRQTIIGYVRDALLPKHQSCINTQTRPFNDCLVDSYNVSLQLLQCRSHVSNFYNLISITFMEEIMVLSLLHRSWSLSCSGLVMADDKLIRRMVFAQCCFILDKNQKQ